jgi:hypothetical protein
VDELHGLIQVYRARAGASAVAKLDALIDIERVADPRVVPFLIGVLEDRREPIQVRSHVLKALRHGGPTAHTRLRVADAMVQVLSDGAYPELRMEAALALGEFIEQPRVPTALGRLALDASLPIDLRYSAFTSFERLGPTAESTEILRRLSSDDVLGRSARSVLSAWHVA